MRRGWEVGVGEAVELEGAGKGGRGLGEGRVEDACWQDRSCRLRSNMSDPYFIHGFYKV